jgi:hypothetical protein
MHVDEACQSVGLMISIKRRPGYFTEDPHMLVSVGILSLIILLSGK